MKFDSKALAVTIVLFAVVLSLVVWIASNGVQSSLGGLKDQALKNNAALAAKSGGGASGGTGGGVATPSPSAQLPNGVSLIAGKTSCSQAGKPSVLFFTDPYCPACVATEPKVIAFVDKFGAVANISFKIVVTHSGGLVQNPAYGEDRVMQAHYYFICAQDQGKLAAFKKLFYEQLKTGSDNDYVPFTKAELDAMAQTAGLNKAALASCLLGAKARVNADIQSAIDYGNGSYSTPMMVVDCRLTGHSAYAQDALCYAFPNTQGC